MNSHTAKEPDGFDFVICPQLALWAFPAVEKRAMCDKCFELDSKIKHHRLLASRLTDQPTIDGIKGLIERMQAEKLALHPEQAK
jgi:hypothetical protein